MLMMNYICKYKTPEGFDDLVMCGDGEALTGLWFEGSRDDRRDSARRIRRGAVVYFSV
jgi:hypothetical protein